MLRIPLIWFLAQIMLRKPYLDFRIAFRGEFLKDDAQIWRSYGDIPHRLDAGVFKVRVSLVQA